MIRLVLGTLIAACLVLSSVDSAQAGQSRWALIIGANTGIGEDTPLRYAERDARRIADLLTSMGGFDASRLTLITGATKPQVAKALKALNRRIEAAGADDAMLLIYYSGHGDAEGLHLTGTKLPTDTLRGWVTDSPAAARVLIVDACRSGAITRVKGGRRAPGFAIKLDDKLAARGVAILSSSAAGENAQESDALEASFFTHHLASGLAGAADINVDGRVTVDEAFHYASEHTLASTTATEEGPQHPTYRLNLGGRRQLTLTRPALASQQLATVSLGDAGIWLFRTARHPKTLVAEVTATAPGRQLSLPPGDYAVTFRSTSRLHEGQLSVRAGQNLTMNARRMRTIRSFAAP